ncbi:DUF4249 domain-containing protein [Arcicella rosea]|uniref:DUF4249 domain-containing protein n=1 Tax=Arcicella rosea TaxID=502909 RepID=A0A841EJI4_9BACT|nr:DUF4249 domain-containing protein [Arcicella rosea]MBB6003335.1 hypothetical protein [Arcicella rosea]
MKIQYLLLVVIVLFFTSCNDDLLTVVEDVDNIPSSTAPTIEAFICPQDTIHQVRLNYTRPIVGTSKYEEWFANVGKAIITISDGTQTATFNKPLNSGFGVFTLKAKNFKVEAGKTYTLKITTYDGQQAEATCTIPLNNVDLKTITVKETGTSSVYGDKNYNVSWDDIPNEANHYSIFVFSKTINTSPKGVVNVYATSEYPEHSITDENNDGKRLTSTNNFYLSKRQNLYGGDYRVWEIQVLNTDIHYYRYHKDLAENALSQDNPFVEPISIYSNIKGGFGIFAAYNRTSVIY